MSLVSAANETMGRAHVEAEVKTGLCAPPRSATRQRFGCKCVRFGIPFSRNPRNPDVGKLLEQGARFRVPGSDVLLANLRAAVYLVDHELRVKEHPDALDSATAGEPESFDESPILRNGVDGGPIGLEISPIS